MSTEDTFDVELAAKGFTLEQAATGFTNTAVGSKAEKRALAVWLFLCKTEGDFNNVYATVGKHKEYKAMIRKQKKITLPPSEA